MTRAGCTALLVWLLIVPMRAQLSTGELRLEVVDTTGLAVTASGTLVSDASPAPWTEMTQSVAPDFTTASATGFGWRTVPSAGNRRALIERGDADISVDLRKPQNDYYHLKKSIRPMIAANAGNGSSTANRWLQHFDALGEKLSIA
jgi:Rad3-related DNA helicase